MKKKKHLPKFKNEAEEKLFWQNNDSSEYIDWSIAKSASFPNLQPSIKNDFNSTT